MTKQQHFQRGDEVMHPRRPEWGRGVVKQAAAITHQGTMAQRLTVDFSNKGRVVINTAVAPLMAHQEGDNTMDRSTGSASNGDRGWLAQLERATGNQDHELWKLPDALTDPFASLPRRLEATLNTYRFSIEPRSLIDWAIAQTQLDDPLSKYTRHELEQAFPRFARDRDQHLFDLVRQIKRSGDTRVLQDAMQNARFPDARKALEKAIRN